MRDFYGDKYVDFLRTFGVNAKWSITDDPELIGKKGFDAPFKLTANTAETASEELGLKGGFYESKGKTSINKTYCTEHGFIFGVFCARYEAPYTSFSHPHFAKFDPDQYWTPERDSIKSGVAYPGCFQFNSATAYGADYDEVQSFSDYRFGMNISKSDSSYSRVEDFYYNIVGFAQTDTPATVKAGVLTPASSVMADAFGSEASNLGGASHTTRFNKLSPISKVNRAPIR